MRLLLIVYTFALVLIGLPIAAQADFTWDVDEGCAPLQVRFAIDTNTVDISTITSVLWDFGNDKTITTNNPADTVTTIYNTAKNVYSIKLTINNNANSAITKFHNGVYEPLISNFTINNNIDEPDYTYSFTPLITSFKPDANYTFAWEHIQINDGSSLKNKTYLNVTSANDAIDQYTYSDTGNYLIRLRVREIDSTYSCLSITDTILSINAEFIVGNVFSPTTNMYYIINPENDLVVLSFKLFSRTGLRLFEQEAPVIYWDGRNTSGQDLDTGVYFYVIEATQGDLDGFYTKKGFIHLYR